MNSGVWSAKKVKLICPLALCLFACFHDPNVSAGISCVMAQVAYLPICLPCLLAFMNVDVYEGKYWCDSPGSLSAFLFSMFACFYDCRGQCWNEVKNLCDGG